MAGHRLIAGGNRVVALAATPLPLIVASTPCAMVWVGAPHADNGAVLNTNVVRLGPQGGERIQLLTTDAGGMYIPVCNANTLYVNVGVNGESVDYVIFA